MSLRLLSIDLSGPMYLFPCVHTKCVCCVLKTIPFLLRHVTRLPHEDDNNNNCVCVCVYSMHLCCVTPPIYHVRMGTGSSLTPLSCIIRKSSENFIQFFLSFWSVFRVQLPTAGRLERNLVPVGSQHGAHQRNDHRLQGQMLGERRRILPLRRKVSNYSPCIHPNISTLLSPYWVCGKREKKNNVSTTGMRVIGSFVTQLRPFRRTHITRYIICVYVLFVWLGTPCRSRVGRGGKQVWIIEVLWRVG